tara:strand:+ start:744 stop:1493 length:750 start_codon:yes stop_codon:yes gene_type:complete
MKKKYRKIRLFGVVCVKDNIVVKSIGFNNFRPAGNIITALQNLENWQVDEIIVLDISRSNKLNKKIIPQIFKSGISTPIAFGGNIRKIDDVRYLLDWNIDRFLIENEYKNKKLLNEIKDSTGSQSLIRCITFWDKKISPKIYKKSVEICDIKTVLREDDNFFSEYLIYDTQADGNLREFNNKIFDQIPKNSKDIILMGGINFKKINDLKIYKSIVGLAFGNKNFEKENYIINLKRKLNDESRNILCRNV